MKWPGKIDLVECMHLGHYSLSRLWQSSTVTESRSVALNRCINEWKLVFSVIELLGQHHHACNLAKKSENIFENKQATKKRFSGHFVVHSYIFLSLDTSTLTFPCTQDMRFRNLGWLHNTNLHASVKTITCLNVVLIDQLSRALLYISILSPFIRIYH